MLTKKRFPLLGLFLLVVSLFIRVPLGAQSLNASLSGTVTDPSGAVIPEAELTLRAVTTSAVVRVTSGTDGLYSFPNLLAGTYELTVSATGFRDYVQRGILLNLNQKVRIDVPLEVGAATETVEVTASASQLNVETAEVKGTVPPGRIDQLPLIVGGISRSAVAFVRLLPGVISAGGEDRRNFETRVNGGINEGDEALLDGVSIVDGSLSQNGIELAVTGVPFSPEAIEEITLLTSNYEPHYGFTTSSILTAVTKSGTNEFHGTLYWLHRNTALNARQFGVPNRPTDLENDYGFTIGGPAKIPKVFWSGTKKTYFFMNWEWFKLRGGVTAPVLSIPTLKMRQGDFSEWPDPIYDPATTRPDGQGGFTRDQFMGCDPVNNPQPNVICNTDPRLVNSMAHQWFQHLPDPTLSGPLNNFIPAVPRTTTVIADSLKLDIRVDHWWRDKDHVAVAIHYYGSGFDPNSNLPVQLDPSVIRSPNYDFHNRLNWDHTFRPNLLNNFNLGYNDILSIGSCLGNKLLGDEYASVVPAIGGVLATDLPPALRFDDYAGYGCNSDFDTTRPAYLVNDLLTWVKGKHTFKFGVDYRALQDKEINKNNQSGAFNFSRLNTGLQGVPSGNAMASFLLGAVDSASLNFTTLQAQYARQKYFAASFGDTWKVTPKLTLTLGLRWDRSTPSTEKYDNLSFFDPLGANPGAGGRPGRLVFAGDKWGAASFGRRVPDSVSHRAFAPRVGIAYRVTEDTVARAGYGIFYLNLSYPSWTSGISPGRDGFNSNFALSSSQGGITPSFLLQDGFPANPNPPPFIDSTFRNGQSIGLYRPSDAGRPSYAQQWNLTIEHQFTENFYISTAYVANKGTRVLSRVAPLNVLNPSLLSMGPALFDEFQPTDTVLNGVSIPYEGWVQQMTGCPATVAQALLPYPQYCGVLQGNNENAGNSTFHSFQFKAENRFSHGVWLLASYTFSKHLSSGNDIQADTLVGREGGSISPFERQRNKAYDMSDVPHTLSVAFVYELPFGNGQRFLNQGGVVDKILGGWELANVMRVQSGIPFFIRSSQCNVPGQFRVACIPAVRSGANPFLQDKGNFDPQRPLLDINAFESASSFNFYYGQGPRVSKLRGFGYHNHDIGLIKTTPITERVSFQFRAEFFNIWNWHVFSSGATWGNALAFGYDVANTATFGRWVGPVTAPRNIQVGAKIIF